GSQIFDFMHKPKGARAADVFYKGGAGKFQFRLRPTVFKYRMIKLDRKRYFKSIKWQKSCEFVAISQGDFFFDSDEFFWRILFLNTGRLNQKHKGTGAAIHDRDFRRI